MKHTWYATIIPEIKSLATKNQMCLDTKGPRCVRGKLGDTTLLGEYLTKGLAVLKCVRTIGGRVSLFKTPRSVALACIHFAAWVW